MGRRSLTPVPGVSSPRKLDQFLKDYSMLLFGSLVPRLTISTVQLSCTELLDDIGYRVDTAVIAAAHIVRLSLAGAQQTALTLARISTLNHPDILDHRAVGAKVHLHAKLVRNGAENKRCGDAGTAHGY